MSSIVKRVTKEGLFKPEYPFVEETIYEVIMGSMAYGVSDNDSDLDIYAVSVPSETMIFPHLSGHIHGFGNSPVKWENQQKHHMMMDGKEYDVNIYSLINYFQLCYENNPNMLDSLFVPDRCVLLANDVGQHMRTHRHMFLSKRIADKMRGYAYSELKKLQKGYNPVTNGKRYASQQKYGFDVKSAYHVVRLMLEAQMALETGDLDLEYNREHLKLVRRGEYTLAELKAWFHAKDIELNEIKSKSSLPLRADPERLRLLLLECLELHFGKSFGEFKGGDGVAVETLEMIRRLVNK
jgi:predicted nucleotidyltransferase